MASLTTQLVGTPVRSLRTGVAASVVVVATSFAVEAALVEPHEFQYLFTFLLVWFGAIFWAVAAAVVFVSARLRDRWPIVDRVVHALLVLSIVAVALLWVWLLSIAVLDS